MRFLKQSTSVDLPIGPFLDATTGVDAETGLTLTQPDIRLKKNGAAWAQKAAAQTLSHEENGYYEVTLDATDTDTLGQLRLNVSESGALPVWEDFMVLPANVWDSLFGADKLQVDAVEWLGGTIATPTVTGVPEVDLTHVGGDAQSQADLKDFADAGYDPSTNKVQGVVLTDTLAAGAITAAVIATDAIDADALAASAVSEIQSGLASQASVDTIDNFLDTEIQAIKDQTDLIPADPATETTLATLATQVSVNTIDDLLDTEIASIISSLATIAGYLDTEMAAVLAAVDTEVTTLLNRIGGFTGTGDNTLLGVLQAFARIDAAIPSDIGGTFDPDSDSLQRIGARAAAAAESNTEVQAVTDKLDTALELDGAVYRLTTNALEQAPGGSAPTVEEIDAELSSTHGAGLWGASGAAGANTVTLTVRNATTLAVLSGVLVTVKNSAGTSVVDQKRTSALGVVTFSLDNGDYLVSVNPLPGYSSLADQALAVDGAEAVTYSLVPVVSATPTAPETRVVSVYVYDGAGLPRSGVTVTAELYGRPQAVDAALLQQTTLSDTTDAAGLAELQLITADAFTEGEGKYKIVIPDGMERIVSIPAGVGAVNLEDLI